jgi:hypothetical protein
MENGMNSIYYFAAWTDSGFLLGCDHEHQTATEPVACISYAGGYVIAVENNVLRALTDEEEAECQCAPRLALSSKEPELAYEASGYAVMVRVRFVDGWGWDTWMRFDTYEQAAAHARETNKIVPFGSVEWNALRQSREPVLPTPAVAPRGSQPLRYEGETLVEFVSRLVPSERDQHFLTDSEIAFSVGSEPTKQAETKSETFVDWVLEWINKWEVKELERIYGQQASARIEALRRQLGKLLGTKSQAQ